MSAPPVAAVAAGLDEASKLAPGSGWATLTAGWDKSGWAARGEVSTRTSWGEAFGFATAKQDAGTVGLGIRW